MTIWHIHADEPAVLDDNTEFKTQDLYAPTPSGRRTMIRWSWGCPWS